MWKKSGWRSGPGRPGRLRAKRCAVQELQAGNGRRHGFRSREHDRREEMVVQVLPHAGEVDADVEPETCKLVAVADPREHEQLGRLDRPAADDDFVLCRDRLHDAVADDLDADATRALEEQALRPGTHQHRETLRADDRSQERGRGALAHAVPDRQLGEPDAVELGAVVIVVEGDAGLLGRGDRGRDDRVRLVVGHHVHRAAGSVVLGSATVEVLRALEERQHVVVAPAGIAEVGPRVVVGTVTADVDHPVQSARAAEHLAPR